MESISQLYNCTPTRPRVFCWGTRQQLVVPNPLCLCLFAATRRSKTAVCLCPCATWSEYPFVSRCNNWPFQNNPVYNPTVCVSLQLGPNTFVSVSQIPLCLVATTVRSKATLSTTPLSVSLCNNYPFQNNPVYNPTVCVCLCSLVRIPLCLCLRYPCVSLQQLSVPKQPCLQPHCLCLFAAWSEYSLQQLAVPKQPRLQPPCLCLIAAWSKYPSVCVKDTLMSRCNN